MFSGSETESIILYSMGREKREIRERGVTVVVFACERRGGRLLRLRSDAGGCTERA